MIDFQVPDMTCGHCVRAITAAVQACDPEARLDVDLPTRRVHISPASADANALARALEQAGYTPQPLPATGAAA